MRDPAIKRSALLTSSLRPALEVLTGAKESIRGAADFFERHPALASALAASLLKRASVLSATPPCEARAAALLRLVYVVNDALFAAQRAAPARPVTATGACRAVACLLRRAFARLTTPLARQFSSRALLRCFSLQAVRAASFSCA